MDARCRIEMLGGLRVLLGSGADPLVITRFRSHKTAALLAYLALNAGRDCSRDALIEVFWPDLEMEAARDNLSTTLSALRRQVEPTGTPTGSVLRAERHAVSINPASVTTDVAEFDRRLDRAGRLSAHILNDVATRADLLMEAITLYHGELLPGFYEEWALTEQARLAERFAQAQEDLAAACEALGRREQALNAAHAAVRAAPLRDAPRRLLMRLLASRGEASAALESFAEFEALLRAELGASPETETRRLASELRRDPDAFVRLTPPAASPSITPPEPAATPPPTRPRGTASGPSLPLVLTRFYGRERELEFLRQTLTEGNAARVVTLLGPGGIGKTRLAVEAARRLSDEWEGRTWFVSMAELPFPALVPGAVAAALGIPTNQGRDMDSLERVTNLLATLGDAPCLLILDNAEHLLRSSGGRLPTRGGSEAKGDLPFGAGLIALVHRLLAASPGGLRILITSRQPLRIAGEQQFPLAPFAVPADAVPVAVALIENASAALYADRARLARPDFAVTDANAAAVADLCRYLDGIPLALEMAGSRARLFTPGEMLCRLREQEYGRLELTALRRDGPERHQSLRTVMAWSHGLLSPAQRAAFRRLSVFRGGWTRDLAAAIMSLGPPPDDATSAEQDLADLEEHSLVIAEPGSGGETRFRMLEPVREFAEECLTAAGETERAHHAHAHALATLGDAFSTHFEGAHMNEWAGRVRPEMPNFRAALEWLLRPDAPPADARTALRIAARLGSYWKVYGPRREGLDYLRRTLDHPHNQGAFIIRATALFKRAGLCFDFDYAEARRCQEEAIAIARQVGGQRRFLGLLIGDLGISLQNLGEWDRAEAAYNESIAIARAVGNRHSEATAYLNLGALEDHRGDPAKAEAYYHKALALYRSEKDAASVALCLDNLGSAANTAGRQDEAARFWRSALREYASVGEVMNRLGLIEWLAWYEVRQGDTARGVRQMAAVASLQVSQECELPRAWLSGHTEAEATARARLGAEEFASAWADGARLTLDEATRLATDVPDVQS